MRLLFVENHATFAATVIAQFLRAHDVTVTGSIAAALERCRGERFDVILVDYDLDDGKGEALCRSLRAAGERIPIIAVSATEDGNRAMMAAGADATCRKADFASIEAVMARVSNGVRSGATARAPVGHVTPTQLFDTAVEHDGFFHPEGEQAPAPIDAQRFHHIVVPALPERVMFCRVRVLGAGADVAHLIVHAHHPPLGDAVIARIGEALAAAFPAQVITFTRAVKTGRAQVACGAGALDAAVAAAVATVQAARAWDESNPIMVWSGEARFEVRLRHGAGWHARVSGGGQ